MFCRIYYVNLPGSIDRELDSIDQKSCRLFFLQNFQLSPSPLRIRVSDLLLLVYKGNPKHVFKRLFREIWVPLVPHLYLGFCTQNLSKVAHIVVYANLLWDLWGAFLYTSLGLSRGDSSRTWWSFSCYTKELKETQAGVLVLAGESKKEGIRDFEACTWSCQ